MRVSDLSEIRRFFDIFITVQNFPAYEDGIDVVIRARCPAVI